MMMSLATNNRLLFGFFFLFCAPFLASAAPEDQHEMCGEWASRGECEANPGYMLTSCATSCAKAGDESEKLAQEMAKVPSFFDLSAWDIDGNVVDFDQFRGQITILTNVASYCGRTEQHYKGLVRMHQRFQKELADTTVNILAFPCNQFGQQEPGTAEEIKAFAADYGVQFQMMRKIDVNGGQASLVYKYLKYHTGVSQIQWNFDTYFLVNGDGNVQALSDIAPRSLWDPVQQLIRGDEL